MIGGGWRSCVGVGLCSNEIKSEVKGLPVFGVRVVLIKSFSPT
jgi:hypothetical protein